MSCMKCCIWSAGKHMIWSSFAIRMSLSHGAILSISLASFGITICHFDPRETVNTEGVTHFFMVIFIQIVKVRKV